ncbi:MAG: class I SAM-dependent methyltransferase [Firmicutes bacterium]|nr:class I SAM-dependent methyltransferase [Bacillota bacterium]
MPNLIINDGRGTRKEQLGNQEVISSGGVPPVYRELLPHLGGERLLDYGSWQGIAGLAAARKGSRVTWGDYLHSRLQAAVLNAEKNGIAAEALAMFPPAPADYATVVLEALPSPEALAMLLAQARSAANKRVLVADPHGAGRLSDTDGRVLAGGEGWTLYEFEPLAARPDLPWRQFTAAVRGVEVAVASLPGMFSPLGLDTGTKLMLETMDVPSGARPRVLDLGCGTGVVGLVCSRLGAGEVVYIDDDLIALTACRRNLAAAGADGLIIHNHRPAAVQGEFDLILTNPPYHTEYGVASSFLEFAARRLRLGGWLYVVVKKPDWYLRKLRTLFGGCRIIEGAGYTVLAASRKERRAIPAKPKTTKKHLRRQAAAKGRGKG